VTRGRGAIAATWLLAAVLGAAALAHAAGPRVSRLHFGDFFVYWTAGRAFVEGANPYDPAVLRAIALREGLPHPTLLWNPPWIFSLLAPFAVLPFAFAAVAWASMNVALLLLASRVAGSRLDLPDFWAMVLGLTFVPAMITLGMGQITLLPLAGAVLYAGAVVRRRPALAGAGLALCAIKPHLVGLLWLTPFLIEEKRDRLRVLLGLATILGALMLAALAWHPDLFAQYRAALRDPRETPPTEFFSASLGSWLRVAIAGDASPWLQFVPFAVGLGWFLWRYRRGRGAEPFDRSCGLALLVSALAVPYAWHYDQATLLPVYLWLWALAAWPGANRIARWRRVVIGLGLVTLDLGTAAMVGMGTPERYYVVWPWVLAGLAWLASREGGSHHGSCRPVLRAGPPGRIDSGSFPG